MELKKKIMIVSLSILALVVVVFGIIVFHKNLPTKSIKLEDIKSVQIINLDRATDRRENYEKMLHDNFGDTFMGREIGNK